MEKFHKHVSEAVESTYTFNIWTWKAYSCLLLPVWALQWTLKLPAVSEVTISENKTVKAE